GMARGRSRRSRFLLGIVRGCHGHSKRSKSRVQSQARKLIIIIAAAEGFADAALDDALRHAPHEAAAVIVVVIVVIIIVIVVVFILVLIILVLVLHLAAFGSEDARGQLGGLGGFLPA